MEDELSRSQRKVKKLQEIADDRKLEERDELSRRLSKAEQDLDDRSHRVQVGIEIIAIPISLRPSLRPSLRLYLPLSFRSYLCPYFRSFHSLLSLLLPPPPSASLCPPPPPSVRPSASLSLLLTSNKQVFVFLVFCRDKITSCEKRVKMGHCDPNSPFFHYMHENCFRTCA